MTPGTGQLDLCDVMALEAELQRPDTRADRQRLTHLLALDFEEVGASGRVWDRASILNLLAAPAEAKRPAKDASTVIEMHGLTGSVIADGVIALRWDGVRDAGTPYERRTRRTSLWRRDRNGWRLVRHQGTVLP